MTVLRDRSCRALVLLGAMVLTSAVLPRDAHAQNLPAGSGWPHPPTWPQGAYRSEEPPPECLPPQTAEEEKLDRALEARVSVDFQSTALFDALRRLAAEGDLRLVLDQASIEEVGDLADHPVTLHATRLRLATVLQLLLEPLELDYFNADGALVVTSEYVANDKLTVRVYPLADLLVRDGVLDFNYLINLIEDTIAPDSWDDAGGKGTLQPAPPAGALVACCTERVHHDLLNLIRQLRTARAYFAPSLARPTSPVLSSGLPNRRAVPVLLHEAARQ